ncbi:MAG: hypothetical protein A2666_03470 [Parcubacteria group bacterium RIFCSPHIGHO2_01_FULL_47_10b]|nr:MAG: hypothetical protein A2666_03470 [Parcubacteria group bacterium RIFCSPHIGHO2_01_FULL_47_10b]
MHYYQSKRSRLSGTNYREVRAHAKAIFSHIEKKTKRSPYIRSAYFDNQKVFFHFFWPHLMQKSHKERVRRLRYFAAAVDLIRKTRNKPVVLHNPMKTRELFYRFGGQTKEKELFYVQIKTDARTHKKYLMSVFPKN